MSNEIRFFYQISQFLVMKIIARFQVLRFTRILTEAEVKCMDVYQNESASSK